MVKLTVRFFLNNPPPLSSNPKNANLNYQIFEISERLTNFNGRKLSNEVSPHPQSTSPLATPLDEEYVEHVVVWSHFRGSRMIA